MGQIIVFLVLLTGLIRCKENKSADLVYNGGFPRPANIPNGRYNGYNGYNRFVNIGGYNTGYYPGQLPPNRYIHFGI